MSPPAPCRAACLVSPASDIEPVWPLPEKGHCQRRAIDRKLRGLLQWRMTGLYIVTQVVGGMVGVWAANVRTAGLAIVGNSAYRTRTMVRRSCRDLRSGPHHFRHRGARAFGHALCSGAVHHFGLLFTASTSFANPAGSRNNDRIAFDLAITIALEITTALRGRHDGTTAHIHFALCASISMGLGARPYKAN